MLRVAFDELTAPLHGQRLLTDKSWKRFEESVCVRQEHSKRVTTKIKQIMCIN
jgi:hypothetical protein